MRTFSMATTYTFSRNILFHILTRLDLIYTLLQFKYNSGKLVYKFGVVYAH